MLLDDNLYIKYFYLINKVINSYLNKEQKEKYLIFKANKKEKKKDKKSKKEANKTED
jgi:hypothetical protein